jgi:hypothetical protein
MSLAFTVVVLLPLAALANSAAITPTFPDSSIFAMALKEITLIIGGLVIVLFARPRSWETWPWRWLLN